MNGLWYAGIVIFILIIIAAAATSRERMTVCADDIKPPTPQQLLNVSYDPKMVSSYPDAQQCVQYCSPDSEQCFVNYSLCVDKLAELGMSPASIYAPPIIEECKKAAADCRFKFLNCANACGQLIY